MTYEEKIGARIEARRATRTEWRALSRHRRRRARGLPALDIALMLPLVAGQFQAAARAWWRRNGPALQAIGRAAAAVEQERQAR